MTLERLYAIFITLFLSITKTTNIVPYTFRYFILCFIGAQWLRSVRPCLVIYASFDEPSLTRYSRPCSRICSCNISFLIYLWVTSQRPCYVD